MIIREDLISFGSGEEPETYKRAHIESRILTSTNQHILFIMFARLQVASIFIGLIAMVAAAPPNGAAPNQPAPNAATTPATTAPATTCIHALCCKTFVSHPFVCCGAMLTSARLGPW